MYRPLGGQQLLAHLGEAVLYLLKLGQRIFRFPNSRTPIACDEQPAFDFFSKAQPIPRSSRRTLLFQYPAARRVFGERNAVHTYRRLCQASVNSLPANQQPPPDQIFGHPCNKICLFSSIPRAMKSQLSDRSVLLLEVIAGWRQASVRQRTLHLKNQDGHIRLVR